MRYFGIDKKDPIWIKKLEILKNDMHKKFKRYDGKIKNYIVDEVHNEYLKTGITNLNVFGTSYLQLTCSLKIISPQLTPLYLISYCPLLFTTP